MCIRDSILHKALQIEVENRYQTAGEMLADIRALLPSGIGLTKDMLGALDPEARSVVAPKTSSKSGFTAERRKLTTGPGAGRTTGAGAAPGGPAHAATAPGGMSGPTLTSASSTTDALATDTAPSKPSRTPIIVGSAALAVVAGTIVAFTLFGGGAKPAAPAPATSSASEPAKPTTAESAAPAAPSPVASAVAAAPSASASAGPAGGPVVMPQAPAPSTSVPMGYGARPAPAPSATPVAPPAAPTPTPPPQPPPKKNPLDVDIK